MTKERRGHFVGIAEHIGHCMTFLIYTEDTNKVIARSAVRSALDPALLNLREEPDHIKEYFDTHHQLNAGAARRATLALSSVTLPDDAQRIRNRADALAMRSVYGEGDVVVCEVQAG